MNSTVAIRGNQYGISIRLSDTASLEQIKEDLAVSFRDADSIFGDESLAISFEGRTLTREQEEELVDLILQNCRLNIVCIMDDDKELEQKFRRGVQNALTEFDTSNGQFYKGNIRSGQVMEFEKSVIIIGDVNAGASVVSKGNIVILGSLRGAAFAGACGKRSCFVVAMDMQPIQLRIADIIMSASDNETVEKGNSRPRIAFLENENIYIEPLNKSVLNDIKL